MSTTEARIVESRDARRLRVLQLSDCHLFADAGERLYDVDPRASLERVLQTLAMRHADADLLLATGDLAQDASADAYRYLAERLDRLGLPVFWIPGNHDDAETMRRCLRGPSWHGHKLIVAADWVLVLLDSTLAGEVSGRVSEAQLAFAERALDRYRDRHALVALHHQAIDCGSEWIDRKGYPDNAALRRRLLGHDNLRAVIWGHVHQQGEFELDGVRWLSAPSTCAQFAPASVDFAVGAEAPGYRWLDLLGDGTLETGVVRVAPA